MECLWGSPLEHCAKELCGGHCFEDNGRRRNTGRIGSQEQEETATAKKKSRVVTKTTTTLTNENKWIPHTLGMRICVLADRSGGNSQVEIVAHCPLVPVWNTWWFSNHCFGDFRMLDLTTMSSICDKTHQKKNHNHFVVNTRTFQIEKRRNLQMYSCLASYIKKQNEKRKQGMACKVRAVNHTDNISSFFCARRNGNEWRTET